MKAFISLAAVALMMVLAVLPFASGKVETKFEDGEEGFNWINPMTTGGQLDKNISLPRNSDVSSGSINIHGDYYIMDEGQEYQSLHWPQNPSMDLFADGVADWAFPGTMGMQTVFSGNATESDLRWDTPGQTRSLDFTMPRATIRNASLTVNNTDARKFSYTMNLGGTQLWSKESLAFAYSGTSFTRDTLNFVTTGDVNGDKKVEMVAGGANGKVYVAKNVNGKWINATVIDLQIQSSQRDILQVALGMLDETPGLDIVAACADGNVYYLLNQGGAGLYSGANQLVSGSPGRMASVCVEDVDNDGDKDIVAGNLNGRFYVFMNAGEASFDPSVPEGIRVVPGGNGQMNSVAVYDIDSDGNPDLIGANSNKNLYIARGTGSGSNFENARPVITTATRDMNSVYVEDVNGDTFKDLIGASNDGRAYICINLGGPNYGYDPGTFDTLPGHIIKLTLESGTNSLRTATAKDVNGDGMPDIVALGTSNSGQIHVAINDAGSFLEENFMRPFSAGQSSKSLAVDDIDGDGDQDIAVTNGMRMDVWQNNQGKFTEAITGPGFLGKLQDYVNNAPADTDRYGNPMVPIHLQINNRFTGALHFSDLQINYSYSALVDFTARLSDYMNTTAGPYSEGEMVRIPVSFKMESAGVLNVGELRIDSEIGLVPIIDTPKENSTLYVKETVSLTGRANKDMDGNILNYTWTDNINGRFLGFGSKIKYAPTTKGNMSIQLRVLDELHDKETTLTVHFQVADKPMAILNFAKVVLSTREPKEGEEVSMKVYIKNTGKVNTTRVAFQVYLDKVQGTPIAADVIQKVDIARTNYTEVFWDATNPGPHKLILTIIGCDQPYTKGKDYTTTIEVQQPIVTSIMPYVMAVLGGGIALGVVGYMIKRRRDHIAIRREKLEKLAPDRRVSAEQAGGQTAGAGPGTGTAARAPTLQPATGQDIYAADRSAESVQRYAAAAEAVAIHTTRFTCPRCGKSTEEEGLLCLECSARDALDKAMLAIDEANEMALDVDHAQELVKKAKADFAARKFADVIEAATKAEDEARSMKDAFDEATSIHGAGAEKAAGPALGPSLFAGEGPKAMPKPVAPAPKPTEKPAAPAATKTAETIPAHAAATTAAPAKPAIAPAAGHSYTNCPKCGKPVQPRWRICPNCQTKLV